jgi:hypothetical protein
MWKNPVKAEEIRCCLFSSATQIPFVQQSWLDFLHCSPIQLYGTVLARNGTTSEK